MRADFIPLDRNAKPLHFDCFFEREKYPEDVQHKETELFAAPANRSNLLNFVQCRKNGQRPVAEPDAQRPCEALPGGPARAGPDRHAGHHRHAEDGEARAVAAMCRVQVPGRRRLPAGRPGRGTHRAGQPAPRRGNGGPDSGRGLCHRPASARRAAGGRAGRAARPGRRPGFRTASRTHAETVTLNARLTLEVRTRDPHCVAVVRSRRTADAPPCAGRGATVVLCRDDPERSADC